LSSPQDIASAMAKMIAMSARAREVQATRAAAHVKARFGFGAVSARLAGLLSRRTKSAAPTPTRLLSPRT